MRFSSPPKGLTRLKLVVIIVITVTLVTLALMAGYYIHVQDAQVCGLCKAEQIGLACKLYANDHDGQFPAVAVLNGTVSYSNTAFDLVVPAYLQTIQTFYLRRSAWTPVHLPDPDFATSRKPPLPAGSNEWAYVTGMTDKSNSSYPLITDGFANLNTHAYTTDATARGGFWQGKKTVVVHVDDSASVDLLDSSHRDMNGPAGIDEFDTTGHPGWMSSTGTNAQHVLNPE